MMKGHFVPSPSNFISPTSYNHPIEVSLVIWILKYDSNAESCNIPVPAQSFGINIKVHICCPNIGALFFKWTKTNPL